MTKVLITNDDGIDAPGLQALVESVQSVLKDAELIVVAPDRGRSECGHSVTGTRPLNIHQQKPNWYSVDGTPVDCVRVALLTVVQPDLVFSGINAGANLGTNLMISGTFAAAREAALQGYPAMAVSHYRRPDIERTWDHCPRWLAKTISDFHVMEKGMNDGEQVLLNVNLPAIEPQGDVPESHWCNVDPCPIPREAVQDGESVRFESDFHGRPRMDGTDVDLCFSGKMTISKLSPLVQ